MFLGTGEVREDEVATEYLDVVALPECQVAVADAAIEWMSQCRDWARVELRCMLDDALLVQAYRRRADLHLHERQAGFRYRVELTGTESDHLDRISPRKLKRMARSRRALDRDGGLEQISMQNESELDIAFKQLTELNHEPSLSTFISSSWVRTYFRLSTAFMMKTRVTTIKVVLSDVHRINICL